MKLKFFILLATLILGSCQSTTTRNASTDFIPSAGLRQDLSKATAQGRKFAISTQGRYATEAALEIKAQGGNLIDSFLAASFVISVERPHSTGIGGGGFLVYKPASNKGGASDTEVVAVDFRERAPLKATKNMFLDAQGKVQANKSINGSLAVAIPGLVAGLYQIHQKYGKLKWSEILQPAIRLAENGFPIYSQLFDALKARADILKQDPAARKIFLDAHLNPHPIGHILKQSDLAQTLRRIAREGAKGFYQGPVANNIIQYHKQTGGLLSEKDFQQYKVIWRKALQAKYKDYEIYSMPPPSSGGIHVIQFLKMMSLIDQEDTHPYSAKNLHYKAAVLQSAFADRSRYLGDPDFIKVPTEELLSDNYLQKRFIEIPKDHARTADQVLAGEVGKAEHTETTHISMMDEEGNAIASTQTINGLMGSATVAPRTGIVLNNEMDDFSAQAGASNLFGAIGSEANAIAPMKTPLSSMSPTLLFKDNKAVMSVGAPGGTRIISCVAQTIHNHIVHRMSLYKAITSIRYHHQWRPDVLNLEPPGPPSLKELEKMGYKIQIVPIPCKVMGVSKLGSEFEAVADPRDIGTAAAE